MPGIGAGDRYAYRLDGGIPRPDPASRSQPEGVHAASEVVDPTLFHWHDQGFRAPAWREVVLYELHVGTFSHSGKFHGVAKGLDRILASGAKVIELMPVATFPGARGWGYDGVQLLAPQAAYGGAEELRALVDACHVRGLALVLDLVLNHFGPEGNYLGEFAEYASGTGTSWGQAIDLDGPGSRWVRHFLIACACAWVDEFHLDGVRLDAVHAFRDRSPVHFVAELSAALHGVGVARGRPVWVIAESDLGSPLPVEEPHVGGWGCDAMWCDDFHHALHAAVTGERHGYYVDFGPAELLARALERGAVQTGRRMRFRSGQHGSPSAFLDGAKRIVAAQNHDQVGNRALGERLATLAPGSEYAVAAALLTAPFVPLLFQGEEWGERAPFLYFTSLDDPELARAVSEGRRRERGPLSPDPQNPVLFERSRIDPERGQAELTRWYRTLCDLRRARPSLGPGAPGWTEAVAERGALVVRRLAPFEETLVLYNLTPRGVATELPRSRRGRWRLLLDAGGFGGPRSGRTAEETLALSGWGAVVLGSP